MAGIRKRRIEADYLKVGENFEFLGAGFTAINEKPNAQTSEKRYVHEASSTQSITSYKWQADFEGDQIKSEKAIDYIISIGKECKTGEEAETEYIKVDLDKAATGDGEYYARKFKVAVSVSEFPDNDGELGVNGSFLGIGEPVVGTFKVADKSFTEGFVAGTI